MKNLLKELRENKIYLSLQGEDIKLRFDNLKPPVELLSRIRENKKEIINYLKKEIVSQNSREDIKIAPISYGGYPLSSAQTRLWILSQIEESSISYNMPFHVILNANYNILIFKKAIVSVIDRHEILRTVFKVNNDGEARQWILPVKDINIQFDYMDLSKNIDPELAAMSCIKKDCSLPFNLEKGPLVRIKLMKIVENKTLFYFNIHHIISDGWSMEILTRDTLEFYNAYLENRVPILPELNIQYKDYAFWQQKHLTTSVQDENKKYWVTQLGKDLPVFELSSSKQRPQIKTSNGNKYSRYISNNQIDKLRSYIRSQEGTLFMGLMTVLKVLLYKYTGQRDLVIGTPIAGRNHIDLKDQIGFYVNTLAIRSQIEDNITFKAFFNVIKNTILNAYNHQRYPFDSLVENLQLRRDTSRSAIFDVMLVLQNSVDDTIQQSFPDIYENEKTEYNTSSKFDLLFNFCEYRDGVLVQLEYNSDIYESDMISQFVRHYINLLEILPDQLEEQISKLSYLTSSDTDQLNWFNDTSFETRQKTVVSLFCEQASKTPETTAVLFEDTSLTYRELEEKSNQLANMLITDYGIVSGEMVGVMLPRSISSVIAIIGILKAGACYVPVDHKYPEQRIKYICEDANLVLMLTNEDLNKLISSVPTKPVIIDNVTLSKYSSLAVNKSKLNSSAFVIYTSGSTGVPKGVVQTHKMLSNLIEWDINNSGIETGLRHLQYTSFSFDVSLNDIFFPLCSSGSVYITNETERVNYDLLKDIIILKSIEVLSFPYSALVNFFQHNSVSHFKGHVIKHILSAGEQLFVKGNLKSFLEHNPSIYLHNHYGPSETHIVTSHRMSVDEGNLVYRPSIGKPINNSIVYILDDNLIPVGIGIKGELYIGGWNLAEGYLNLLDQTNLRFIPHPLEPENLMYKTGDLGYWKKDGTIEYLGREDKQIKIRGYRVELEEIVNNIINLAEVEEAIVVIKTISSEDYLCAYIVSSSDTIDMQQVRKKLEGTLPLYMIPNFFIKVDTIPLTSNGKINKNLLPSPLSEGVIQQQEYIAPRDEIETKLVEIWEELLGVKKISVNENFFALGGHSIKLIKLVNSYYKIFNIELKLKDLFVLTTIEKHAELIGAHSWIETQEKNKTKHNETINF